ncbi:hypothetical protein PanWU01x14_354880, partial [Parasponia andersonii]
REDQEGWVRGGERAGAGQTVNSAMVAQTKNGLNCLPEEPHSRDCTRLATQGITPKGDCGRSQDVVQDC